MYLSRELTDSSLPKIGKEFGGRDHTTVMHANAKIDGHDPRGPLCVQPCAGTDRTDQASRMISVDSCVEPAEPVDERSVLHRRAAHRPKGLDKRIRAVFPVVHTPYDFYEKDLKEDHGIETQERADEDVATTGSHMTAGMKITCSRDELVAKLGIVSRAVSTRGARAGPRRGSCSRADGGGLSICRHRHGAVAAHDARGRGRGRRRGRHPGQAARRPRAAAARERGRRSSTGPEEGVAQIASGSASYRLNTYAAEDFPRLPARRRAAARDRPRGAARDRGARRALRLAGRVAPGAHRASSSASRRASSSWPRPTPTGCPSRRRELDAAAPELEAIIPARALQELARLGAAPATRVELGVHENHVVFGDRRRLADHAPHRRPVPELPAAAAGGVRARADARPQRAATTSCAAIAVLAQRNSPLRLRFAEGELTVSAQTQDVGEAQESLPVAYSRRGVRDRLQRRVPARRRRLDRRATTSS